MDALPNDVIGEIILAGAATCDGLILIVKCFGMTCRRILDIYRARIGTLPARPRAYADWVDIGNGVFDDHATPYSTGFIVGLCRNVDIYDALLHRFRYSDTPPCSRLFSAMIKSKLAKIANLGDSIPHPWITWAIRKVGVESLDDVDAVIRTRSCALLHEAFTHHTIPCIQFKFAQWHYRVARQGVCGVLSLHRVLIDCGIEPTVDELRLSFSFNRYSSAMWIYQWLSVNKNIDKDILRYELFTSDASLLDYTPSRIRTLINIKETTVGTEQDMVEFICRRLTCNDLKAYVNNCGLSLYNIDVKKILAGPINDPIAATHLMNIGNNMAEVEPLSDSE